MAGLLIGALLLAYEVALTVWLRRRLKQQGRRAAPAWRRLLVSASTWLAVTLILGAVSVTAAGAAMALLLLVIAVHCVILFGRGVRSAPEFLRQIRRMGEAEAWRGR